MEIKNLYFCLDVGWKRAFRLQEGCRGGTVLWYHLLSTCWILSRYTGTNILIKWGAHKNLNNYGYPWITLFVYPCIILQWSLVSLYPSTLYFCIFLHPYPLSLYPCILVSLYLCISVFLYPCIPVSLYLCTPESLYPCIPVPLYPCIPVSRWRIRSYLLRT